MSRSRNSHKGTKLGMKRCGKEYWASRLHRGGEALGRYTKQQTARKERRRDHRETRQARIATQRDRPAPTTPEVQAAYDRIIRSPGWRNPRRFDATLTLRLEFLSLSQAECDELRRALRKVPRHFTAPGVIIV